MPRRKRSKKWISWVVIAILLVIAGVVVYFVWDGYFRDKGDRKTSGSERENITQIEKDNEGDTVVDTEASGDVKKEEEPAYQNKPIQYEGESVNKDEVLGGVINYAQMNAGKLMIRTSIYQYLESGSCELVIMAGGSTVYTATVEIMSEATSSTCKGFDVPVAGLPAGDLDLVVYLSSGDKTGEISGGISI